MRHLILKVSGFSFKFDDFNIKSVINVNIISRLRV